jgi:hypothetical protein
MTWMPLFVALFACGGSAEPTEAEAPTVEPVAKPEAPAEAPTAPDPQTRVFFIEPADGATVKSPVNIRMGLAGMAIRPAGTLEEGSGHHHIIIGPAGIETGKAVPKDETHIHFGKGQTESEVELDPGQHTLTLQFADGNHMSYGEALAASITITVE